jgi:hypothetical protein
LFAGSNASPDVQLDLPVVDDTHGFTETNVSKANYPDPGPQSKTDASI